MRVCAGEWRTQAISKQKKAHDEKYERLHEAASKQNEHDVANQNILQDSSLNHFGFNVIAASKLIA